MMSGILIYYFGEFSKACVDFSYLTNWDGAQSENLA